MKRAALALVAALALPAGVAAQTTVDQRRPAAPDGAVSIENMAGSIKVTGWDRAEVQVRGTIADNAELELTGPERKVHVEVSPQGNPMAKSDLDVMVPAGSSVSIEGFQATIVVGRRVRLGEGRDRERLDHPRRPVEGGLAPERERRRRDEQVAPAA